MKLLIVGTLVLLTSISDLQAQLREPAKAKSKAKSKSSSKVSKKTAAKKPAKKVQSIEVQRKEVPNFSTGQLRNFLKKATVKRVQCELKKCPGLAILKEYERVLQSFIMTKDMGDYLAEENRLVKQQLRIVESSQPIREGDVCLKTHILKQLMLDNGITENGSVVYSKRPMGTMGGVCYSNNRKKKDASVILCHFPLAINIYTKGGTDANPITRRREYMFKPNGCDPASLAVYDEDVKGLRETSISYQTCVEEWNKRLADATMTQEDIKLMEDTIGFCFRQHLLPPHNEKSGRENPRLPANAKKTAPVPKPPKRHY